MKYLLLTSIMLLSGCSLLPKPDINISAASIDRVSPLMQQVQQNGRPRAAIPVSVYAFRDQTGRTR